LQSWSRNGRAEKDHGVGVVGKKKGMKQKKFFAQAETFGKNACTVTRRKDEKTEGRYDNIEEKKRGRSTIFQKKEAQSLEGGKELWTVLRVSEDKSKGEVGGAKNRHFRRRKAKKETKRLFDSGITERGGGIEIGRGRGRPRAK